MVSGGVTFASVAAVCLVVLPSVVAQAPVSGDCAVFSTMTQIINHIDAIYLEQLKIQTYISMVTDTDGPIGLQPAEVQHVLAITVDLDFAQSLGSFDPPAGCVVTPTEPCTPTLSAADMANTPAGAALLASLAQSIADQLGVPVSTIDISDIGLQVDENGNARVTGGGASTGRRLLQETTRNAWAFCSSRGSAHTCAVDISAY